MRAAAGIAALLLIVVPQLAHTEGLSPRAAFGQAYARALSQERCSRVDHYLLETRPAQAKGRPAGAVKPGLEEPLRRLQQLRMLARSKGLSALMRSIEARWRKLDATADYVCQWDPVGTPQDFDRALDEMTAQLRLM